MSDPRIIVFLKVPRSGEVKTRIAAELDATAAAAIYEVMLGRTLDVVRGRPGVELRFTPDDAEPVVRQALDLPKTWTLAGQGGGDLGTRLTRAAEAAFDAGAEAVVIVGSDCPAMERADLDAAIAALAMHPAVLGPARDGGYWLVGLRRDAAPVDRWFEGIAWSTNSVFAETVARAQRFGVPVHALRELRDVDTLEDWRAWLRSEAEFRSGSPEARWD